LAGDRVIADAFSIGHRGGESEGLCGGRVPNIFDHNGIDISVWRKGDINLEWR
jgi:hypothetical protein